MCYYINAIESINTGKNNVKILKFKINKIRSSDSYVYILMAVLYSLTLDIPVLNLRAAG